MGSSDHDARYTTFIITAYHPFIWGVNHVSSICSSASILPHTCADATWLTMKAAGHTLNMTTCNSHHCHQCVTPDESYTTGASLLPELQNIVQPCVCFDLLPFMFEQILGCPKLMSPGRRGGSWGCPFQWKPRRGMLNHPWRQSCCPMLCASPATCCRFWQPQHGLCESSLTCPHILNSCVLSMHICLPYAPADRPSC